jgi:hypothetical protein
MGSAYAVFKFNNGPAGYQMMFDIIFSHKNSCIKKLTNSNSQLKYQRERHKMNEEAKKRK